MALVTTFVSSPLTSYFYPLWYQKKVESWRRGEIDWDTGKPLDGSDTLSGLNTNIGLLDSGIVWA